MERWREIPSVPPYQASDLGRIRNSVTGTILGTRPNGPRSKYRRVSVKIAKGKYRDKSVHRLVAEAWLGASCLQVNHKNGIVTDNCLANLEYVTAEQNYAHARATGLYLKCGIPGEKHPDAKFSNALIRKIRDAYSRGKRQVDLARAYGVSQSHMHAIVHDKKRRRG